MGIWLLVSNVEGYSMASVAPEGVLYPRNRGILESQDLLGIGCRIHRPDPIEASGSIVLWLSACTPICSPKLKFEDSLWVHFFHVVAGIQLSDKCSRLTATTVVARSPTEKSLFSFWPPFIYSP